MKFLSLFRHPKNKNPKKSPYVAVGEHYDLKSIYDRLNSFYFNDGLNLSITWFGCPHRKVKSQRILGLFDFSNRLIKVHRLLDHPRFPPYFISYIVYHEMLHSVLPPLRRKGRSRIHHEKFKEKEKCFTDYTQARDFEKQNLKLFFMSREGYGGAQ